MPLKQEGVTPNRPTWMQHAMSLAHAARWRSEDPFCQVGATVLNAQGVVVGVGYNGTLPGLRIDWADREGRRDLVLHAEANALRHTTPMLTDGGAMAVTHFPCVQCTLLAGSYGIKRIAWTYPPDWERYPADPTMRVAKIAGISITQVVRS